MKTWKLTVNEDELRALITHHLNKMFGEQSVERSARIHDLTKRLNKETPEIENAEQAQPQQAAPKSTEGWN